MNDLENILSNQNFEDIKHIDENGIEYWYARELQSVLGYKEWRKFDGVIQKAQKACEASDINCLDHFVGADKTIPMPKGAAKNIKDYKLTRYACYLIAQNGDSRDDIAKRKGLRYREDILDNMGGDELIANLFRIPEDMPTPQKSLKQLEKEKISKNNNKMLTNKEQNYKIPS